MNATGGGRQAAAASGSSQAASSVGRGGQSVTARPSAVISGAAELASPHDAAALQVASTLANVELRSMKQTLEQYTRMYQDAIKENDRLAGELRDRDQDAIQVVEFLRAEVERKGAQVFDLEARLAGIEETLAAKHRVECMKLEADLHQRDDTIASLRSELKRLQDELDALTEFRKQRVELQASLREAHHTKQHLVAEYEKKLSQVKFASLEEKVKLRATEQAMVERFASEVNDKALQLVDAKAKTIREDNAVLAKDKALLDREVQRLTQVGREAQEALIKSRREAALATQSQMEFARQGCLLSRSARDDAMKVKDMERRMSTMANEFDRALEQANAAHQEALTALRRDLDGTTTCLQQHRRELIEVRTRAKLLVDNRTALESFFHHALNEVVARRLAVAASAPTSDHADDMVVRASHAAVADAERAMIEAVETRHRYGHRGDLDARTRPIATPRGMSRSSAFDFSSKPMTPRLPRTLPSGAIEGEERRSRQRYSTGSHAAAVPPLASSNWEVLHRSDDPDSERNWGASRQRDGAVAETVVSGGPSVNVDFAAMTWDDKERIIRALLFELSTSMNGPPATARVQPETVTRRQIGSAASSIGLGPIPPAASSRPSTSASSVSMPTRPAPQEVKSSTEAGPISTTAATAALPRIPSAIKKADTNRTMAGGSARKRVGITPAAAPNGRLDDGSVAEGATAGDDAFLPNVEERHTADPNLEA